MDPFNIRPFSSPNGLLQSGLWGAENPTEAQVRQKKEEKKQISENDKEMNKQKKIPYFRVKAMMWKVLSVICKLVI